MESTHVEGRLARLEERAVTPEGVRQIVREEIASMAGLVLRRTQMDEAHLTRSIERNAADDVVRRHLAEIFGEVLRDFSGTDSEPGA